MMPAAHDPLLHTLLGSSAATFLAEHWPTRALVHHGPPERLAPLLEAPALASPTALGHAYGEGVVVWFGGALASTPLRELYGRRFAPLDALALHHAGATLFFERVDRWVPALVPLCRALERALGLLRGSVYCSAFASPAQGSSLPHFDPDLNLSIQLAGRKRWRVAPNRHVVDPTRGYSILHEPHEIDPELARCLRAPLPRQLPDDALTAQLEPGSVIFVPRGHWHATETLEASFALVFVAAPKTWLDLALATLRAELVGDPRWRATARDDDAALHERAAALRERAAELAAPQWRAALGRLDPWFRRRAAVRLELDETGDGIALRIDDGVEPVHLELDAPLVPLVRRVLGHARPFARSMLEAEAMALGEAAVDAVLAELVACGALEDHPTPCNTTTIQSS